MTIRVSHEVLSAAVTLIEGSYRRTQHRSFLEPFLVGMLCTLISFYCGLIYGSLGFLYGAIITVGFGYFMTRDCYISVENIIRNELDPEAREELHLIILKAVRDMQAPELNYFDVRYLLSLLLSAVTLQQGILNAIEEFLIKERKLSRGEIESKKKKY